MKEYTSILDVLKNKKEKFVLLGDFNINLLNYKLDKNVANFADLNFEKGCIPLITRPTRVTTSTATCIDNIVTNNIISNSTPGILIEDISDHFPVFYCFAGYARNKITFDNSKHTHRNTSKANLRNLNQRLSEQP